MALVDSLDTPGPVEKDALWPHQRSEVLDWLVTQTSDNRYIDNIFVEMCVRLRDQGISIARASMNFLVQHPQWRGARILWRNGEPEAAFDTYAYGSETAAEYLNSPLHEIHHGAEEVRQALQRSDATEPDYQIYRDLRKEGLTDYVAWPLQHTFGKRHVVTFASDRPKGFLASEIETLKSLAPAIALVSEIRLKNRMARTLLETYVGPHASQEILDGATRRGSGNTVSAVIMICDLRDFTRISDLWPRDDVIELLNGYFDAMADPIEKHGGEILKFMGDGLLAIFPLNNADAATNLVAAIQEAQEGLGILNASNVEKGHEPFGYGIGVHVGDVMYGNIGSRTRLDFTVIGPAVNIASRLETLTKTVGKRVLLSEDFVGMIKDKDTFESLGPRLLRGLEHPIGVYALRSSTIAPPTA